MNICNQSGTFVTIDELTLMHHNHLKSTVYIRVYFWCFRFYGFGQIYNDMYPLLKYHAEYFHYQFIYPFTHRRTSWLLPCFGNLNKANVNIVCMFWCDHTLSTPLGKYQGAQLLDHIRVYLVL